jgi:hypothetical protein
VGTEQRKYELAVLVAAGEALAGPVSFLNNNPGGDEPTVKHLTANAAVLAKRVAVLAPKA